MHHLEPHFTTFNHKMIFSNVAQCGSMWREYVNLTICHISHIVNATISHINPKNVAPSGSTLSYLAPSCDLMTNGVFPQYIFGYLKKKLFKNIYNRIFLIFENFFWVLFFFICYKISLFWYFKIRIFFIYSYQISFMQTK